MKIKTQLFLGFSIFALFIISIGVLTIFELENTLVSLILLDDSITDLQLSEKLLLHAVNIKYYDEVLTQSARNYAFTGDEKWKLRYLENEPFLSNELSHALELGTDIEKNFFNEIDVANKKLVEIELQSIKLVETGDLDQAAQILDSPEYLQTKANYEIGLEKYLESRNLEHTVLQEMSMTDVDNFMDTALEATNFGILIITLSVLGIIIGAIVISLSITKSITKPISQLHYASEQILQGNLDVKTTVNSNDEIGQLSKSFGYMIEHLKTTTDIEDRFSLQQNLRRALDESSIVSIIDKNGKITYVNETFCKISKYSKEELIGKRQDMLRSTVHPPNFYAELWTDIAKGKIWHGEICNKAKDDTLFWNDVTIVPFSDKNGNIYEYVSIRTDITYQKNLSNKLVKSERLSAIGELSARIAHDIRNPLGVIRTSLENIEKKHDDPEFIKKSISRCNNAVYRIAHQIDDVMSFLKESPLNLEPIELSNQFESIKNELVIPNGIQLILPTNTMTILADKIKIESLFTNLILNAIQKLNDEGIITIKIFDETNNMIKIEIEDNGESIPTNDLDKVFEPLYTTKQTGTGLGLASCKKIVLQHGGEISVTNNPVTFSILLPSTSKTNNN